MKLYILLLLATVAYSAPVIEKDDVFEVKEDFFPQSLVVYESKNDIVNLLVPLNRLNFDDSDDGDDANVVFFFVEGDIKQTGIEHKGLYISKDKKITKLLDNGADFTARADEQKSAYFAATDGIYVYNPDKNTADKYGSVTDNIINIVAENGTDNLYILTTDKETFKVTDNGNKKVKIADVHKANQIMLDFANNLYYYGDDKVPYVVSAGGVKKVEGLPQNPSNVAFTRPSILIPEGVPFISDDKPYMIYENGTSEYTNVKLSVKPTAYAPDAGLIQYYAHNKKVYEYNILSLIMGQVLEELRSFLTEVFPGMNQYSNKS